MCDGYDDDDDVVTVGAAAVCGSGLLAALRPAIMSLLAIDCTPSDNTSLDATIFGNRDSHMRLRQ
jgi:hypothetical protein